MFILTKRLYVRPLWREDADAVYAGVSNWNVAEKLARVPFPYARTDAERYLADCETSYDLPFAQHGMKAMGIFRRGSLEFLGCIGLHGDGEKPATVELGYWLAQQHWGHGYASEAAQAVVAGAFLSLGLAALVSGYHSDNAASARVLRKCGFVPTRSGTQYSVAQQKLVPTEFVALTRAQWLAQRLPCAHAA